ncbi:hypothetical protein HPG69_013661, partial [Diceros bicornis minor]
SLIMLVFNNTNAQPLTFLLTGIPGLKAAQVWISIPVCLLYVIALSGNSMILFVILREQRLHEPMYHFLCMLSATDLSLSLCTLSTTLGVFWNVAIMLPVVLFVKKLSFCSSTVLSHSYCYHVDLIQLSCTDNRINSILAPPFVHTIMANVFLLIPPVLNPIIYSVKTKQIRKAIVKVLIQKRLCI